MPAIKITSLAFDSKKFRKLRSIAVPIAPRITVIAGHNGIGKSTILALLAHPSGLTKKTFTSYFDKTYQANFNEIIHLDYLADFKLKLGPPKILAEPQVTYLINEKETLVKACRLGPRGSDETRMVARSVKPKTTKFISQDGAIIVGPAGKVPLPTIYLGMTRVLPLGEAEPGSASSAALSTHEDDRRLISNFVNAVVSGSNSTPAAVTVQRIKETGKASGQPQFAFDPRCVSLGQDSIGSIALALASFQKLKREWTDYPGGLLIIDEIDSGLHPHAIAELVKMLKLEANKLSLQIIATTHSPSLITAVHPDSEPLNRNPQDGVVYIRDPGNPSFTPGLPLKTILNDMELTPNLPVAPTPPPPPPVMKVYFEDDEAAAVFKAVCDKAFLLGLSKKHSIKIEPLPLGVGCDNLAKITDYDQYFKCVVIVLDADATVNHAKGKNKNIVKLPGDMYNLPVQGNENPDIMKRPLSPERSLLQYILTLINDPDANNATLSRLAAKDITTVHLANFTIDQTTTVMSKREPMKAWWERCWQYIEGWGLLDEWAIDRPIEIAKFQAEFEIALEAALANRTVLPG